MKFIQFILCGLVVFIISTSSYGQHIRPKSELGVTIGYNYGYFKDLNYAPLNYQQKGLTIGLDYTFFNRRNSDQMNIHIGFSPNSIETNTAEYFTSDLYHGRLQFDYLKKLKTKKAQFSSYLGGQFNSNNQFVFWEGTNSFTYTFAHSLSAKGLLKWQLKNNQSIRTSLSIPMATWLVRPPYNGFNKTTEANEDKPLRLLTEEGKLTSINKYRAFDWHVEYRFATGQNMDWAVGYDLQYQHYKNEHSLTRLENQVSVKGIIKF